MAIGSVVYNENKLRERRRLQDTRDNIIQNVNGVSSMGILASSIKKDLLNKNKVMSNEVMNNAYLYNCNLLSHV